MGSAEIRFCMLMIVMLSMAVQEIQGLECESDFTICHRGDCIPDIQCDPGFTAVDNAGECGCCPACVQILADGNECFAGPYATPANSNKTYTWYDYPSVCGDGLYCDRDASVPTCKQGESCEADICERTKCTQAVCASNQKRVPNGGWCGCCYACVTPLDEGSDCFSAPYPFPAAADGSYIGFANNRVCEDGLFCDEHRMAAECRIDDCANRRDSAISQGIIPGQYVPHCNVDGGYNAKQCGPGAVCYCVDENNVQLEHTVVHVTESQDLTCYDCVHRRDAARAKQLIGQYIPQCNPDGTYTAKQCGPGPVCHCVDDHNNKLGEQSAQIWEADSLTCYDCLHKRAAALSNTQIVGQYVPQCNPDGSYTARQCGPGPECHCVDDQNNKVGQYSAPSWEAEFMTCLCAREKDKLQDDMMQCTELGNFIHIVYPPNRAFSHESMTSLLIVMACLCLMFIKE